MASDVITGAITMIGAIIVVSMLISALFPEVLSVVGSIQSTTSSANDRVVTSATVINHELGPDTVRFDVLNNGKNSLQAPAINMTIIYMDNVTTPNNLLTLGQDPDRLWWNYTISGAADGTWDPGDTLVITVTSPRYNFSPDDYRLRMLLYNGACTEYRFDIPE